MSLPAPWAEDAYDRYKRGSQPMLDGAKAIALEQILADFGRSQEAMQVWFAAATEETLASIPEGTQRTLALQLNFLVWHEAYHAGQVELLRHVAGKHESLI